MSAASVPGWPAGPDRLAGLGWDAAWQAAFAPIGDGLGRRARRRRSPGNLGSGAGGRRRPSRPG